MSKLTPNQADRLRASAGKPFTPQPNSKRGSNSPQDGANLTLNETSVLMQQALHDTGVLLGQVDEIWQAAEETVIEYFDQRGTQAKGTIATTIMDRMGLTQVSAEASELGFFEESAPDIRGRFAQLLLKGQRPQQMSGQTIETPVIAAAEEVPQ